MHHPTRHDRHQSQEEVIKICLVRKIGCKEHYEQERSYEQKERADSKDEFIHAAIVPKPKFYPCGTRAEKSVRLNG